MTINKRNQKARDQDGDLGAMVSKPYLSMLHQRWTWVRFSGPNRTQFNPRA